MPQPAARILVTAASAPGTIQSIATSALPPSLAGMPGAASCMVSGFFNPVPLGTWLTIGAEMVVVRTDGNTAKAYDYVLATSSQGQLCINGPYKHFPGRHFHVTSVVNLASLFGHHPFTKACGTRAAGRCRKRDEV